MEPFICDCCGEERPDTEANHLAGSVWCDRCVETYDASNGETEYDDRFSASDAYNAASDLKWSLR